LLACSDDFLIRDLLGGNVSTESDVEFDSSGVESRFLRNERDGATVRLHIERRYIVTIDNDTAGERIAGNEESESARLRGGGRREIAH
jgi:hypothetical protein